LKLFADIGPLQSRLLAAAASCLAVALAGCGASTPRQADVESPAVVKPAETPAPSPATEAAATPSESVTSAEAAPPDAESSEGRRRGRRASEPAAPSADAAVAEEPPPIPEAVQQTYDRALAAMRGEDWLGAQIELEQLVHDFPAYPGPEINLAIVYMHLERNDDARAALDHALTIAPDNPQANNELGILLRQQGKFDDAEQAYRRALAADPSYALAHYNLGVLLDVYLRKPEEALEHYEFYQSSLAEPDKTVAGWIIDLRRRIGNADTSRVAKEDSQ
jgi:tetratricopeptide (TPR) repeat protein